MEGMDVTYIDGNAYSVEMLEDDSKVWSNYCFVLSLRMKVTYHLTESYEKQKPHSYITDGYKYISTKAHSLPTLRKRSLSMRHSCSATCRDSHNKMTSNGRGGCIRRRVNSASQILLVSLATASWLVMYWITCDVSLSPSFCISYNLERMHRVTFVRRINHYDYIN